MSKSIRVATLIQKTTKPIRVATLIQKAISSKQLWVGSPGDPTLHSRYLATAPLGGVVGRGAAMKTASASTSFLNGRAALLGRETVQIRKTDEDLPRISIIDVIAVVTGRDKNQAAEDLLRLATRHPDVKANCFNVKSADLLSACVCKVLTSEASSRQGVPPDFVTDPLCVRWD